MSCCTTDKTPEYPRQAVCPRNGKTYHSVALKTLLQQVRAPRNQHLSAHGWYFCDDPDCDVVYFSQDDLCISREAVRQDIGQKSHDRYRTLCYCFDISVERVNDEISSFDYSPSYEFVVQQTKAGNCACEARNPSGRCCLKDFPKAAKPTRQ